LKRLLIPKSIELLEASCFSCALSLAKVSFEAGSQLRQLNAKVFYSTQLKKVAIPRTVEIIGDSCFADCINLSTVAFEKDSNLSDIGPCAFNNTGIVEIVIPHRTVVLRKGCFSNCALLTSIRFEDGSVLEAVEEGIFGECPNLTFVTLPNNVRFASRADWKENNQRRIRTNKARYCSVG
jgi:hypothetical protein